jgi:predicted hydrocarbon binding protein
MMFSRQLNFEKGEFEMLGIRGAVIPVRTFTHIIESVYEKQGDEVFDILFETGREHGKLGVEKLGKKHSVSKREFLEEIIDSGNVMGLGKAKIKSFNPQEGLLRVNLKNSPFEEEFRQSEVLKDIDRSIDEFQRGVFHSMAEAIFDGEVKSREDKCSFKQDERCEFIFKEVD